MKVINRGDKLFWARIVPCCGVYEIHDICSIGNVSEKQLRKYIENQG